MRGKIRATAIAIIAGYCAFAGAFDPGDLDVDTGFDRDALEAAMDQMGYEGLLDTPVSGRAGQSGRMTLTRQSEGVIDCRTDQPQSVGGALFRVHSCVGEPGAISGANVEYCARPLVGESCRGDDWIPYALQHGGTFDLGISHAEVDCDTGGPHGCHVALTTTIAVSGGQDAAEAGDDAAQSSRLFQDMRDAYTSEEYTEALDDAGWSADCFVDQHGQLTSDGDITDCSGGTTVSIWDPEGERMACAPDTFSERCETEIPTQVVACDADEVICEFRHPTDRVACGTRWNVEVIPCEAGRVIRQWSSTHGNVRRIACDGAGGLRYTWDNAGNWGSPRWGWTIPYGQNVPQTTFNRGGTTYRVSQTCVDGNCEISLSINGEVGYGMWTHWISRDASNENNRSRPRNHCRDNGNYDGRGPGGTVTRGNTQYQYAHCRLHWNSRRGFNPCEDQLANTTVYRSNPIPTPAVSYPATRGFIYALSGAEMRNSGSYVCFRRARPVLTYRAATVRSEEFCEVVREDA